MNEPAVSSRGAGLQARRRAETRTALLDATVECLATNGYVRTTTGRIAVLAGVSRGAQLPYFRNRAEMLTAAVAHLAEQRIAAFTASIGDRPATVERCLDALWEGHRQPIFDATLELWVAARTDPELDTELRRVENTVGASIARAAELALGDLTRRPTFKRDLVHVLAVMRGIALLPVSDGATGQEVAEHWARARPQMADVLRGR